MVGVKHIYRYPLLASVFIVSGLFAAAPAQIDAQKTISALSNQYGERAGKRAKAWFKIVNDAQQLDDITKLEKVNGFFNLFKFVDDSVLWGESNYWASPMEFIGVSAGDCEDFSIAKYFTLLQVGIPEEKLRITMVKATSVNQYHMVLAYYETPGSVPLVLDNLDPVIKPATKRSDLLPVYSFNGKQLWLNKEKGRGVIAGSSSRLEKWNDLQLRLGIDRLRQPKQKME
ncbi:MULTISPECIES: transglutaminase-like cysteine peptidase [unclassified Shewanella]|uniref:transglutaminase-like cysteine peptidase n=1 Tax=unclassified Shewanella TaxID=196818 RepID=UPI00355709F3